MSDQAVMLARAAFAAVGAGLVVLAGAGWCAVRADACAGRLWWLRGRWRAASDACMVAGGLAMVGAVGMLGLSVLWWRP